MPFSMRMRLSCLVLGLLLAIPARCEQVHLTLLHTTDLHGALDGWDYLTDRPAARGLTRIATLVRRARAEGNPTLLLDAGDAIQGGVEFAYQHSIRSLPEPMMSAMSAMGYDAMALGNHEFSFGADALDRARRTATFPLLSANLVRDSDHLPVFEPSIVKVVAGVRVGIVGLTTPATALFEDPENLLGLHFISPLESAKREVARLREEQHCDVVVLVAHTGLEREALQDPGRTHDAPGENSGFELASAVEGADVLILGHTHVVIPSRDFHGLLVTQAGKLGENLGRVDLTLERDGAGWKVTGKSARVIAVTDSVPEDSSLSALAAPWHAAARESLSRVVGTLASPVGSPEGRLAPGAAWELIHRAQLEASGADVSFATLPDPGVTLPAGPVRIRDIWRLYPYDNTLSVIELSGAKLRRFLEETAHAFLDYAETADRPLFDPAFPLYNFDSASGIGYEIDLTRPADLRIQRVTFRGAPLADSTRLRVAVNSYRVNGGGGFFALRGASRIQRISRSVAELIADLISKHAPFDPAFETGWRVRPDYAIAPERNLIDRLVRSRVLTLNELSALDTAAPVNEAEGAAWLARAFDWRAAGAKHTAGTPDSLGSWLAGLQRHGVFAGSPRPAANHALTETRAIDWCARAARAANFESAGNDASLRRSFLTGLGSARADGEVGRARWLGMISNLRFPTVRVLETTDFHGFILSNTRERRSRRPVGGSIALASWVKQLRDENLEGTILVDGGDWFQGTMISNLQFGRPVVEQMNALEYTAAAIGNHDFDWSADTLARRAAEMRFATLGANCIEKKSGRRPRYARADTVVTRRGVRIGILGLCYRETPTVTLAKNVAHLRFEDDSATAARLVPELRKRERAQIVIAIGHVPGETDSTQHAISGDLPRLARGVPGVDAWLGGHSHNQISDEIGGVPVLIAGAHAEVVGVVDLTFDPVANRVIEHRVRLQPTFADAFPPDSAWSARVAAWNASVAPIASQPIGRCARRLTRSGDNTIGYLVTDAMRAACGADVALTNSGGLRADLPEGVITRGAIYEVMPFDNTVVTLDMTGAELRQMFEDGLKTGRVLQSSGIRLTYDPGQPEQRRVVNLTLDTGAPLDPVKKYRIAINNFIATGGDGITSFAKAPSLTDTRMLLRDAIEAFVKAKCTNGGAIEYQPEGRIQRLGGARE
ncbi:MAG: 5'-nucleotidase C-terminal domain-containing protein [Candidatus Eisenbacteria bacterium]|nr:5'-nucleotidase C-terminal domain-containing protein [Candidatus Eisenbacteria bacterium]